MSLVGFLADLRQDLAAAREQAVTDAVANLAVGQSALWLEVDEMTVTVEVAHTGTVSGKATGRVEGKFWVFGGASAGAEVGGEASRTGTQTLTLTLKPRLDTVVKDDAGTTTVKSTDLLIESATEAGEQIPDEDR